MKHNFLLEIGTEELPPSFIKPALEFLKIELNLRLRKEGLIPEDLETFGTPRRLIVIGYGLPETQPEREEIIVGPSLTAAFDSEGKPTKAAIGFARSKGASVEELVKVENPPGKRGIYVAVKKKISGKKTKEILSEIFPELILNIPFKKRMSWGDKKIKFARPIRWITAIFGEEVVSFELDGIRSSNVSYGHRFLSPEPFTVKEASSFIDELEGRYVIADIEKRKGIIIDSLNSLPKGFGGKAIKDKDLLNEVTNLVEYPVPVIGSFDREFLQLPKEVPMVVMKDHQRYFSIEDDEGNLKNHFIAVSNIKSQNELLIIRGYEKVLRARLADALFFYNEDRKKTLEERVPLLKGVVFHDKLGTIYDKVERLKVLCPFISGLIWKSNEIEKLSERAAYLSKSDLITEMVNEFPELQGIMGKYYAINDGEDERVAKAIEEQYLPRFLGDKVARTQVGISLSLSDKIDTLVGFFGVDIKPTGSEDPFALRRNAIGIIHTVIRNGINVKIRPIIEKASTLYRSKLLDSTCGEVERFIKERLKALLVQDGFDPDVVDSVINVTDDLLDIRERTETIQQLKSKEDFEDVMLTFRRVMNIIPEGFQPVKEIKPSNVYERELLDAYEKVKDEIEQLAKKKHYREAFLKIKELKPFVDRFFDNVLVMDKDEKLKNMRLSLLKTISDTLLKLSDFRKIKPS